MKRLAQARSTHWLLLLVIGLSLAVWQGTGVGKGRQVRFAGSPGASTVVVDRVALEAVRHARPSTSVEFEEEEAEPLPTGASRRVRSRSSRAELMSRLPGILDELRDDDVPGNATRTVRYLERHSAREDVDAALEGALFSDDAQERHFAARSLRWRTDRPSRRLLEVSVEGLRNDGERGRFHPFAVNAGEGVAYLLDHGDAAWDLLLAALGSSDLQQRFLAAATLARIDPARAPAERVVPILVRQLEDNRIRNDAVIAAGALYGMGLRIVPRLERALGGADAQARSTLELILLDLRDPPRTREEYVRRRKMQRISHADPCLLLVEKRYFVRYVRMFEDF